MFALALYEVARIYAIDVGQPDQDLHRDRALIALHQIQIARRDIEFGGHGRLGKLALPAQPLEPGAGEDFSRSGGAAFMSDCLHADKVTMYESRRYAKIRRGDFPLD